MLNAMPASFPQYVTEAITGPLPDPPGVKLQKEGLKAKHPVVFVPGIVTGGLELWEGHQCAEGLFRKRLWGGAFGDLYKRPLCWVEHMSLDNETGLDPSGVRIRPVSGLVAADYFAPGYFVWAVLIANLARIGYEEKNMYMAAYDWRISFQNTEVRDQTLSRIKSSIELMVATSEGKKVVIIPHSMGALYFLHFMKWVEAPPPMGGGGGSDWCSKHIKAVMNIGGPFLGVPKVVSGLFSAEAKDIAVARAIAPGVLDIDVFGFQTLQHVMRMTRTWDSTMSMIPKGGDTIWGGLDWSPEEGYKCFAKKAKNNVTETVGQNGKGCLDNRKHVHYGRMISFGKDVAEAQPTEIERMDFKPWEEKLKSAHEQGTLVHLSNLDPEYTSGEVEVALLNGITMGGGAGFSIPGTFKVATDKTVFATPETLIGFHPDAGASFYLSHLPGHLGEYLALTGDKLNGIELISCGLATHYSISARLPLIEEQLGKLVTDDPSVVETSLAKYGDIVYPDRASVVHRIETLDKCFSHDTVEEIIDALESEAAKTHDDWCTSTLKKLQHCSPLSLKVSLRSIREGRFQTLDQCLVREYLMSLQGISKQISNDFCEGVRARVVDKDMAPKWNPPNLEQVSKDMVDQYFSPLSEFEPDLVLPIKQREAFT